MELSILKGLSENEKKQALLRISQYVLRESSKNARESIYKRMLEVGVYLIERNGKEAGKKDILEIIKKQFFGIKLDEEIADEYLEELKKEGNLTVENGTFSLSENKKSQLEDYSKNTLNILFSCEGKFTETVAQNYGRKIPNEDNQTLIDCYYNFVLKLVSMHVATTTKLLLKGTLTRISTKTGKMLANMSISRITDKELREAARKTLMNWMQSPDDDFIEYLFHARQNFLCMEILNLDPECRLLEREEFSKKILFLDTNVLLSTILETEHHEQTKKLVENSRKLGCKIFVTRRTLKEFNFVLTKSKKYLGGFKATPHQLSKVDNVFISSYAQVLHRGTSLSSEEYFNQFSNLENILGGIGIEVWDDKLEEIRELPKYSELASQVQRCYSRLRNMVKTVDVAEHDAFHLLFIKTVRDSKSSSFLGPDFWFLTYDLTLSCCDRFIQTNFNFQEPSSPVMPGDLWNDIISPFLIGIVTEKDLVEVFKSFISSEFTPISEGLNAGVLANLGIDWTEFDWLEIEEIQEITRQKFVLVYLSRRQELFKTEDKQAIEQLRSEFNIAFSRLIGKISSRKIEDTRSKLEAKKEETKRLASSVKALEEKEIELRETLTAEQRLSLRMRYVTGLAGIALLIIGTIQIILMRETVSLHIAGAYVVFLIIGGILLLIAIKPGQVTANLGASTN